MIFYKIWKLFDLKNFIIKVYFNFFLNNSINLHSEKLDILHIPTGYISSIQALEEKSKLVVMADYHLGELNDEFRYPKDYFTIE